MGTQRITHPSRTRHVPLRIALFLLLCLISRLPVSAQTPTVSALSIPLILPSAIVFDAAGNLYFAETGHHFIRKLDTLGNITTIAGTGTQGFSGDEGPATSAALDSPQGLALDTANNLYIADTHSHRIRELNLTTGNIITVAGNAPGFSGDTGPATSAQLNLPTALALDATGNLYIADTGNHRIRKLSLTTGIITTIAGTGTQGFSGDDGPATSAAIDSPTGLAIDTAGNLYLADTHNNRIREIAASTGTITTIAGNGSPGFSGDAAAATSAALALPHGLSFDAAGNLYLADTANHRIRRIDALTGIIATVAGDGTQAFSGDGGPATSASLDSPGATSLSPANLLTLSDTNNERIRQLTAQPAPGTTITTIAGLGTTTPGALTLSAPTVIPYGIGQLIASLNSPSPATGTISFLDTSAITNVTITLGTATVVSNAATLPITTVPAGIHNITATYSGDQTHLAAQSRISTLTITPLPLTATATSITRLYGQSIPAINGTITGILPQDAANITATFTTTATSTSPVGTYPITATLNGAAAGNYTITASPITVTINPAPTSITLSNLVATATSGSTVTLTTNVTSGTTGTPTGSVTLLDGTLPISTTPISPAGAAVFTINTLAAGSHTLTAVYDGSTNFTPSSSAPQLITIGTGPSSNPDFTLAPTGAMSQTILSGTSASFTFSAQMQGNLSSAITLAATGLPNLATASFNPPTLPPGINTFTLTIATPNTTAFTNRPANTLPHPPIAWAFLLCPIAGLIFSLRKRNTPLLLFMAAIISLPLMLTTGCGDRISPADALALNAKTYTITVTGTATAPTGSTLQHSTTVTLLLEPAN
jgi:sugar lactone lactonase YvrE